MRVVIFCHSLVSDWNHGNAHFLRGITTELGALGHRVDVFEPEDGWSRAHLLEAYGPAALERFARRFPALSSHLYRQDTLDLDRAVGDADLVLVHEWNEPWLVAAIGRHHAAMGSYRLLFHDTHHRSVTAPEQMRAYDLSGYDGVLAFGEVVRQRYLDEGWTGRAWTWHEAADTRVFSPRPGATEGDLVWIGNWGDDERTAELEEFLIDPVAALGLRARVHGVRYPDEAIRRLSEAGIEYAGWLPNADVPAVFGRYRATMHVPRRPYVAALPGIPTIRVFEALACGIPLVSAPWDDAEALFGPDDFLMARDGPDMRRLLRDLLAEPEAARAMAERGLRTVLARHTCAHRVDQLLAVHRELTVGRPADLAGGVR
ncbi:MAG TPA: glycosyltransferase [Gemmatimonadales bacterium]|nr:glycosyltransferase [Gemmatimonadales bacterium]